MKNLLTLLALSFAFNMNAQVGIGTSSPNAAAALDVVSTSKGLVPPRMTAVQRDDISSPPAGLMLWCIDCGSNGELQVFNGTAFTNMTGGAAAASLFEGQIGSDIDGEAAGDQSGGSVSLSSDGTIVAIGAVVNTGSNGAYSGHVRVFQNVLGTWTQLGGDIDGEAFSDRSGYSVSLSSNGTIVAIGAIYNNGNGSKSGHVRVYQYNGSGWIQYGGDIDGEAQNDLSGNSVSLSSDGTIVAIGALMNDGNGSKSGHVRVYQYNSGLPTPAWVKLGADINGEAMDDYSGGSVSLSDDGTIVAIGAVGNDDNGSFSGHVRVYQYNSGLFPPTWEKLGADIDGEAANDYSGTSVSLSSDGTIVAIGATGNAGNGSSSGHVRVYQYTVLLGWSQYGGDIDGEASGDNAGASVSLSSDGTIVAIGAIHNGGYGTGLGHVRVYQYNSGLSIPAWVKLGADIDGEAAGDQSGGSVSLSSDGTIVAIGAIWNAGNGSGSGHVRVIQ